MKKILLLTTTLFISTLAFADAPAPMRKSSSDKLSDYYAKIETGISIPKDIKRHGTKFKSKAGFVIGLGGGYRFNEFFRSDLMLQYRQAKSKKVNTVSIKYISYDTMLNGYLDAHNDTIFTPYLVAGVGIGHARAKFSNDGSAAKKTNFVWNVGLGCQAKVYDKTSLDLGYRYVHLGDVKKDASKIKLGVHKILLGFVYNL